MSHEVSSPNPTPDEPVEGKQPRSTWPVVGLLLLLLLLFMIAGGGLGFIGWLLTAGLLLLVTALYSLVFRRKSWARLPSNKQRKIAVGVSAAVVVLAFTAVGVLAPRQEVTTAGDSRSTEPTPSETVSDNPSPSPTEESPANQPCDTVDEQRTHQNTDYLCTLDNNEKLVWMDKGYSEQLTEARRAAEEAAAAAAKAEADRKSAEEESARLTQEKAEAERQAASDEQRRVDEAAAAAEAQRLADEAAAVAEQQRVAQEAAAAAEAQRIANEAAAAEAQRLAEEQANQQDASFQYRNCTAVREAGAAPIREGEYGWHEGLDADNDGMACGED